MTNNLQQNNLQQAIGIRFDRETLAQLGQLAAQMKTSRTEIVRRAVQKLIEDHCQTVPTYEI